MKCYNCNGDLIEKEKELEKLKKELNDISE